MTRTIEPALSAEEWADMRGYLDDYAKRPDSSSGLINEISYVGWVDQSRRIPFCIAALNAALPDSDPRKITREKVELLGEIVKEYKMLQPLADALRSYLPPLTDDEIDAREWGMDTSSRT